MEGLIPFSLSQYNISIYTVYPIVTHLGVHHHKSWHLKGECQSQHTECSNTFPPSLWELCDDSHFSGKHENVAETGEAAFSFHTQYGKSRDSGERQSSFERHSLEKTELEWRTSGGSKRDASRQTDWKSGSLSGKSS